jgi:hypothetical protein
MTSIIIKKIIKDPLEAIASLTIDELEEVITYTNDKYRNSEPVISDQIYDLLIEFLEARAPKSKVLKQVGAPVKIKNKVKLDYTLASMDKIKPTDVSKLEKWTETYKAPYYASDKLDGVSALLLYTIDNKINKMGSTLWNKKKEIDIFLSKNEVNIDKNELYSLYCKEFMNKKIVSKLYFNQHIQFNNLHT